jgi:hypothetical protein
MRNFLLAILMLSGTSQVLAEQARPLKLETPVTTDKPLKGKASSNSCAAYGPGFVKLEGTDTCVQIGGSISIGAGTSTGRR